MVASSAAPLLLLDGDLNVIAASDSFCQTFHVDPAIAAGGKLCDLGDGDWNVPQLSSLLNATAAGYAEIAAYEMDLRPKDRAPRRLVLNAQRLAYGEACPIRLLLTVADVTDARLAEKLKDDLLREKAILLQELQHRVANSLQIIASVLLQSARRVNSDETRNHLNDAHNRVMSVAVLQQQLAVSRLGDVALRGYFTDLCASISASMIADHDQLSLSVAADESVTPADVSVSLGLIITELVINALKHAFPGRRAGRILVAYHAEGPAWSLSVEDDGVGMPKAAASARSGLGTSIVEALAKQLGARVQSLDTHPGTSVSVIHA
jgi:two-component sensor histidine kinase